MTDSLKIAINSLLRKLVKTEADSEHRAESRTQEHSRFMPGS